MTKWILPLMLVFLSLSCEEDTPDPYCVELGQEIVELISRSRTTITQTSISWKNSAIQIQGSPIIERCSVSTGDRFFYLDQLITYRLEDGVLFLTFI